MPQAGRPEQGWSAGGYPRGSHTVRITVGVRVPYSYTCCGGGVDFRGFAFFKIYLFQSLIRCSICPIK